jgi:hypothetical protein
VKYPANVTLGRKLTRKYHRSTCAIWRKTPIGWVDIAVDVPCLVSDSSDRPPRPDPWDAGSDNVRTWNVSFVTGTDVRMRDQLRDVVIKRTGEHLPTLTVATDFGSDYASSDWVVAHAEDSAVEKLPVVFYRLHADDSTTSHGPYMMTVDWEDVSGTDPSNYAGLSHLATAILTVDLSEHPDFSVRHGDFTSKVDNRAGQVIEVRREVAGRREVRVQFDIGARD